MPPAAAPAQVPVTILTGFLGAGKTTLLNRILSEDHGRRWAVIVNELGEIGIDGELVVGTDEELFQMSNGCVCCTVRGDLIRTLHRLLAAPATFDAIVVETTGLADPGPVVQTFLVDAVLQARTSLDSVTTLVDALNIGARLADSREAAAQVAFADQIILNKTELVPVDALPRIEAGLRRLNPWAPIHRARRAEVPLGALLGRGSFDLGRLALPASPADPDANPAHGHAGHVHDESCSHGHELDGAPGTGHGHIQASGIASVSLACSEPMSAARLTGWLERLVAAQGPDILRLKGIIDVAGEPRRLVVQGVHMLLEGDFQRPWRSDEPRTSRLVLIGRGLDEAALRAGFIACSGP